MEGKKPKEGQFTERQILQDYMNEFAWLQSYLGLVSADVKFKNQLIATGKSEYDRNNGSVVRPFKEMAAAEYGLASISEQYTKDIETLDILVGDINKAFAEFFNQEQATEQDGDLLIAVVAPLVQQAVAIINQYNK